VVTVDVPSDGSPYTIRRNNEFYTLGHFASFILPGSVKLATTQPDSTSWLGMAVQTAGSGRVVQLLNNDDGAVDVAVVDALSGGCFVATVEGKSLSTFVWSDGSAGSVGGGEGGSTGGSSGLNENGAAAVGQWTACAAMAVASMLALLCL